MLARLRRSLRHVDSDTVQQETTKILAVMAVTIILLYIIHATGYSIHPIGPMILAYAIGRWVNATWLELLAFAVMTSFALLFVSDHYPVRDSEVLMYMAALVLLSSKARGGEVIKADNKVLRAENADLRKTISELAERYEREHQQTTR